METLHRPSLTLVCDSQRKDLANLLDTRASDDFLVFGHILPGAPLHSIIAAMKNDAQIKTYSKKDWNLFAKGSNDVAELSNHNRKTFTKSIVSLLKEQTEALQHTNIILSTIPYNVDMIFKKNLLKRHN